MQAPEKMENCSHSFLTAPRTRFYLSQQQNLSLGIVFAIASFFAVLMNSLLIFSFAKAKQFTNSTNVYIIFLSLSDCLLIGAVTLPLGSILHIIYGDKANCILTNFALAFSNFSAKLSGYFTLLIGFDRFMKITTEFKEDNCLLKKLKSKCGSIVLTFLCFASSVVQGGVALLSNKYVIISICVRIIDVIAVITVYTLYIRVYLKVRRHYTGSVVYKKETTGGLGTINGKCYSTPRYMKGLTETVLLILIIIAICYLPYLVLNIYLSCIDFHTVPNTVHLLHTLTLLFVYMNSGLNACVILYRNEEARKYLARKVLCAICYGAESRT